jgi:hypothetical protein
LRNHVVFTAEDRGWDELENGDLLMAAERDGFEVFLTADKNLRYRQNLSGRAIAIVVLGHSPWLLVKRRIPDVVTAVNGATPGSYTEADIPLPPKDAPA